MDSNGSMDSNDSNRSLRTEECSSFWVIVADRDGVRKYVSKSFPSIFQYTLKVTQAHRFYSEAQAQQFIGEFNAVGKYIIVNPQVCEVIKHFKLIQNM